MYVYIYIYIYIHIHITPPRSTTRAESLELRGSRNSKGWKFLTHRELNRNGGLENLSLRILGLRFDHISLLVLGDGEASQKTATGGAVTGIIENETEVDP